MNNSSTDLLIPLHSACEDEWRAFSDQQSSALAGHLCDFILERFSYKPRYIRAHLHSQFGTVTAFTKRYDLYIRLFGRPDELWPRERLVLARITFLEQRAGHGRTLVNRLVELAPLLGYRYIGIESTNDNSSAFAKRLGFTSCPQGCNWLADIDTLKERLESHATT